MPNFFSALCGPTKVAPIILPYFEFPSLGKEDFLEALKTMASGGWISAKIYHVPLLNCAARSTVERIYTFNLGDFRQLAPIGQQEKICAPLARLPVCRLRRSSPRAPRSPASLQIDPTSTFLWTEIVARRDVTTTASLSAGQRPVWSYAAFERIREAAPLLAEKWLTTLFASILSLDKFPARCPVIPEAKELGYPARHLLYGKGKGIYRIIFHIREHEKHVQVLRGGILPAMPSQRPTWSTSEVSFAIATALFSQAYLRQHPTGDFIRIIA